MTWPIAVAWLGYASLLVELLVLAVPSVASTLRQMQGRPTRRWALLHLLPVLVAVTGFVWPGVLAAWLALAPQSAPVLAVPPAVGWFGALTVVLGRALTLWAVVALRQPRTAEFTTKGPYRSSRNPALLGLHVFLLGAVAIAPAWSTALGALVFALHMHRAVLAEERHLSASAGAAYATYCATVPRYLPTGRKRVPR